MPVNIPPSSTNLYTGAGSYEPQAENSTAHAQPITNASTYSENATASQAPTAKYPLPSAQEKKQAARQAYDKFVVYHVTERSNVKSIRKNGFSTTRKTQGATAQFMKETGVEDSSFSTDAKNYNYVMTNKEPLQSLDYFKNPSLVRTFIGSTNYELDPEFFGDKTALRTPEDIPAGNILGSSKTAPRSSESRIMKEALAQEGVHVSHKEAGKLLRDVQSDSEDDF